MKRIRFETVAKNIRPDNLVMLFLCVLLLQWTVDRTHPSSTSHTLVFLYLLCTHTHINIVHRAADTCTSCLTLLLLPLTSVVLISVLAPMGLMHCSLHSLVQISLSKDHQTQHRGWRWGGRSDDLLRFVGYRSTCRKNILRFSDKQRC